MTETSGGMSSTMKMAIAAGAVAGIGVTLYYMAKQTNDAAPASSSGSDTSGNNDVAAAGPGPAVATKAEPVASSASPAPSADASAVAATVSGLTSLEIKDKGNVSFKAGDFKSAARLYSEAIAVNDGGNKVLSVLYTNRAACHLSLKAYENVVEDCTVALGLNPNKGNAPHSSRSSATALLLAASCCIFCVCTWQNNQSFRY